MNARVLVVALVLPLVAAIVVSTALAGRDGKGRESMAKLRGVNFVSSCTFSHRAPDDPIVFFGQAGASHDHSFVGNTGTNAFSASSDDFRVALAEESAPIFAMAISAWTGQASGS